MFSHKRGIFIKFHFSQVIESNGPIEGSPLDNYLTILSFFQLNCVSESFVLTASQLNVTFFPFNAFLDIGLILITGFKVLPSVQI
jgi:hypothetical protein